MGWSKGTYWLNEEIELLTTLASRGLSCQMIAQRLGRTIKSVSSKAEKLKISFPDPRQWTTEEDNLLQTMLSQGATTRMIADTLQRSMVAVRARSKKLGLPLNKPSTWTDADDKLLMELHNSGKNRNEIADIMGRLPIYITQRLFTLRRPLKKLYYGIFQRCTNPKCKAYPYYGGRGITVAQEWLDYETFERDCLELGWRKGLTIDRVNVNGNYEKSNVRFISMAEQAQNRRPPKPLLPPQEYPRIKELYKTHTLQEVADLYRVSRQYISSIIHDKCKAA